MRQLQKEEKLDFLCVTETWLEKKYIHGMGKDHEYAISPSAKHQGVAIIASKAWHLQAILPATWTQKLISVLALERGK